MKKSLRQLRGGTPDPVDVFVGLRVKTLRKSLGMSQTALAERMGVSFQQIQKYETGVNRVSASSLVIISKALGVPLADLFPDPPAPNVANDPDEIDRLKLYYDALNTQREVLDMVLEMSPEVRQQYISLGRMLALQPAIRRRNARAAKEALDTGKASNVDHPTKVERSAAAGLGE